MYVHVYIYILYYYMEEIYKIFSRNNRKLPATLTHDENKRY